MATPDTPTYGDYDDDLLAARQANADLAVESRDRHPAGTHRREQLIDPAAIGYGYVLYTNQTLVGEWEPSGVVVDVVHGRDANDDGEIVNTVAYRCYRYTTPNNPYVYLEQADIRDGAVDDRYAWQAIRFLVRGMNAPGKRRPSDSDLEQFVYAGRLAQALLARR